jgi:hypothetical protein
MRDGLQTIAFVYVVQYPQAENGLFSLVCGIRKKPHVLASWLKEQVTTKKWNRIFA